MVEEKVIVNYKLKDGVSKGTAKITKTTQGLNKSIWGKLGAIAGMLAFAKSLIVSSKAAREQDAVLRQTQAVIKSTGGAAGLSAKEINEMAVALQKTTNFGDEVTQRGQNLLLTFTKIGRDVFPQATKTMLDMSVALGQDVKTSAIQLGKALNDPILGATALRRVGVNLTDQQMDQIKVFQESGDVLSAQKLILKELAVEFGGSAEAQADAMTQISNKFGDFQETIGRVVNALAKALQPAVFKTLDIAESFVQRFTSGMSTIAFAVQSASTLIVGNFFIAFKDVQKKFNETIGFFKVGYLKIKGFFKDTNAEIVAIQEETAKKSAAIDKQTATTKKWMKNDILSTYKKMEDGITAHHEVVKKADDEVTNNKIENAVKYANVFTEILTKQEDAIQKTIKKRIMTELQQAKTLDDVYRGVARSAFNTFKETLIAQLFAKEVAAIAEISTNIAILASNPLTWGFIPAALGALASAASAVAVGTAGINAVTPKFANGGMVQPTNGGTNVIMGEAGETELGLPSSKVSAFLDEAGVGSGQTVNVYVGGRQVEAIVTDEQRASTRRRSN